MNDRDKLIKKLNIDEQSIKPCASFGCCHYGEGCALGYPIVSVFHDSWGGSFQEEDADDLKMIYSPEFKKYWEKQLQKGEESYRELRYAYFRRVHSHPDWNSHNEVLACSHQGCSFNSCNHLHDRRFMSRWYKSRLDNHG